MNFRALTMFAVTSLVMLTVIVMKVFGILIPYFCDLCHAAIATLVIAAFCYYSRAQKMAHVSYLFELLMSLGAGFVCVMNANLQLPWMEKLSPQVVSLITFVSFMVLNLSIDICLYKWQKISGVYLRNRSICFVGMSGLSIIACLLVTPSENVSKDASIQTVVTHNVARVLENVTAVKMSLPSSVQTPQFQMPDDDPPLPLALPYVAEKTVATEIPTVQTPVVQTKDASPAAQLPSVTPKFNVTTCHNISAEILNRLLKGVLKGKGELFVHEGEKNNISPAFLAAVSMHESANGASKMAVDKHNVMGVYGKGSYRTFDSVDDCISFMSEKLASYYIGRGKKTIAEIQGMYAPVGASNDPKGLNNQWTRGVVFYLNKIVDEYNNSNSLAIVP